MKRAIYFIGSVLWFAFAVAFGVFAWSLVDPDQGAAGGGVSLPFTNVILGLVHFTGLIAATGLCLLLGISLGTRACVPRRNSVG